ncbi:hypothetical protein OG883_25595 [Streptomyces sp. NBC_01142]|uniref:hypothetical protein n=1 Tax=Streptomyces sp. NBC_01142 TaxID=2975865 RepID=UPI00224F50D7|nr:hypothetical protein [Streptomyces sp. NBC_01142]MCX4823201.1 hypothetical protein [Streptomyces sp. NBC_01142]
MPPPRTVLGGAHQDNGPDLEEHTMACTDPQCTDGLIPNPRSTDPEDVTLCPVEYPDYDADSFREWNEG